MKSEKRHVWQFAIAMGIYVVLLLPTIVLMELIKDTPWRAARGLLVFVPVTPVLCALRAFVRGFGALDELERRIHLEAFAFSLGCTGMLTFTYGLLEAFVDASHISLIFVLPVSVVCWGFGVALASRRYR